MSTLLERCRTLIAAVVDNDLARHVLADLDAAIAQQAEPVSALLERCKSCINAVLTHMGMDEDEWNKPTFDKCRATLAELEEAVTRQAEPVADELVRIARLIEDLKRPCGDNPESAQALRNGRYQSIAYAVRAVAALNRASPQPPAAQPSGWMPLPGDKLWLWKNGDHFLAFRHLYPCFTPGGDPMVLGEPVGYAVVRQSFDRSE